MRRSTTPMRSCHRCVRVKSCSSAASASASAGSRVEHLVVGRRRLIDVAEAIVDTGDAQPVVAREGRVREALGELAVECNELALRTGCVGDALDLVARLRERRVVAKGRGEHGECVLEVVHAFGAEARRLALEGDALLDVVLRWR